MSRRRRPPACQTPEPRHSLTRARLYPAGWLCDRHSPWAQKGLPEPKPGPGWPRPIGAVVRRRDDSRPITSGENRSSQTTYRAAQAAMSPRKASS